MSGWQTQFPKPPELRPLNDIQGKIWHNLSNLLLVSGSVLLLMGGWQLFQYYIEATKPPPAPIINSLVAFETLTSSPTAQLVEPTPTLQLTRNAAGQLVYRVTATPSATPSPTKPVVTTPAIVTATLEPLDEIDFSADVAPFRLAALTPPAETPTPASPAPITRIVAQSIDLDAEVVEVGWETWTVDGQPRHVWRVADYAVGWHKNSALPGDAGNIVLSAHHNIKGELFRYTIYLELGDIVSVYEGDQRFDYVVSDKFIVKDLDEPIEVRRANAKWIGPFDEERLTLVTCWPYVGNTHRAIVIAKPLVE